MSELKGQKDRIENARYLCNRQEYHQAIALLSDVISGTQSDSALYDLKCELAEFNLAAGQLDSSIDLCEELLRNQPDNVRALLCLSEAHIQQGNYDSAEVTTSKALHLAPSHPGVHEKMARLDLENHRWSDCLNRLQTLAEPEDLSMQNQRIIAVCRAALRFFQWVNLIPGLHLKSQVLRAMRKFYRRKMDHVSQEAITRILISFYPDRWINYRQLGGLMNEINGLHFPRRGEILPIYSRALQLNSEDDTILHDLGLMHYSDHCYESARVWMEKIPADSALKHSAELVIANASVSLGAIDAAVSMYRNMLQTDPSDSSVWLNLVAALYENSDFAGARTVVTDAVTRFPDHSLLLYFQAILSDERIKGEPTTQQATEIFNRLTAQQQWDYGIYPEIMPESSEDTDRFELVPCPVCGSQVHKAVYNNGWPIVKCDICGHLFVNPQPTEKFLHEWYQSLENKSHTLRRHFRALLSRLMNAERRFSSRWLVEDGLIGYSRKIDFAGFEASLGTPRKMIDLGTAVGWQPYSFSVRGWDSMGLEISDADAQYARDHGLNVMTGTIETADLPANSFDLVLSTHTIEHLRHPEKLLVQAREILKPGGLLVVSTPCADSLPFYWCGPRWMIFGEHIQFFSRQNLVRMCEEAGLTVLDTATYCGAPTQESYQPQWFASGFSDLIGKILNRHDQGDVLAVFATKGTDSRHLMK